MCKLEKLSFIEQSHLNRSSRDEFGLGIARITLKDGHRHRNTVLIRQ